MKVNPAVVETGVVAVGTTDSGRSTTTVVSAEEIVVGPRLFVATTETLMYLPISLSVSTYVLFDADAISENTPADIDARCHWYANVGEPVHVPDVAVKVEPVRVVPETTGRTELLGAAGIEYLRMTTPEPPLAPWPYTPF